MRPAPTKMSVTSHTASTLSWPPNRLRACPTANTVKQVPTNSRRVHLKVKVIASVGPPWGEYRPYGRGCNSHRIGHLPGLWTPLAVVEAPVVGGSERRDRTDQRGDRLLGSKRRVRPSHVGAHPPRVQDHGKDAV